MMNAEKLMGYRLVPVKHLITKRVQYRRPYCRSWGILQRVAPLRWLRLKYVEFVRRRWRQDEDNWTRVPSKNFYIKDGAIYAHPALINDIKAQAPMSAKSYEDTAWTSGLF